MSWTDMVATIAINYFTFTTISVVATAITIITIIAFKASNKEIS